MRNAGENVNVTGRENNERVTEWGAKRRMICCPRPHLILAGMNRVDLGHSSCLVSIQLQYLA